MSELISVVIPVFNCKNLLQICLESVVNQTYSNMQIILVDDGSTDGSGQICEQVAKTDSRIEVYHIENCGVSHARNLALQYCRGTYVYFADADDYLNGRLLEKMLQNLKQSDADCVVCNYKKLFHRLRVTSVPLERAGIYQRREYLRHTIKDPGHHYYGVLWNKLYRMSIIREEQLQFREDMTLGEDFVFNLNYYNFVRTVCVIPETLYYYRRSGPDTLSRREKSGFADCKSEMENRKKIYQEYVTILKKNRLYGSEKIRIARYWVMFQIRQNYLLRYDAKDWKEEERISWRKILRQDLLIQKCLQLQSHKQLRQLAISYTIKTRLKSFLKQFM